MYASETRVQLTVGLGTRSSHGVAAFRNRIDHATDTREDAHGAVDDFMLGVPGGTDILSDPVNRSLVLERRLGDRKPSELVPKPSIVRLLLEQRRPTRGGSRGRSSARGSESRRRRNDRRLVRARLLAVLVRKVEDGTLKGRDLGVDVLGLDMRLELAQVVDGALAVGGGDHVLGILPDFFSDLAPGLLDGGDAVDKSAVLESEM